MKVTPGIALLNRRLDGDIYTRALPLLERVRQSSPLNAWLYDQAIRYWTTPSDQRTSNASLLDVMDALLTQAVKMAASKAEQDALLVIYANRLVFAPADILH